MRAFRASAYPLATTLVTITLLGCGGGGGSSDPGGTSGTGLYSAYKVGAKWTYKATASDSPSWTYTVEVAGKQAYSGVQCLKFKVGADGDFQYSLHTLTAETGVLRYADVIGAEVEPYVPPAQWGPPASLTDYSSTSTHSDLSSTISGHVVSSAEGVTVPYGTFTAVHARNTISDDDGVTYEDIWWVPGVGMVKEVFSDPPYTESAELTTFTPAP
jgi:hypothetical protein